MQQQKRWDDVAPALPPRRRNETVTPPNLQSVHISTRPHRLSNGSRFDFQPGGPQQLAPRGCPQEEEEKRRPDDRATNPVGKGAAFFDAELGRCAGHTKRGGPWKGFASGRVMAEPQDDDVEKVGCPARDSRCAQRSSTSADEEGTNSKESSAAVTFGAASSYEDDSPAVGLHDDADDGRPTDVNAGPPPRYGTSLAVIAPPPVPPWRGAPAKHPIDHDADGDLETIYTVSPTMAGTARDPRWEPPSSAPYRPSHSKRIPTPLGSPTHRCFPTPRFQVDDSPPRPPPLLREKVLPSPMATRSAHKGAQHHPVTTQGGRHSSRPPPPAVPRLGITIGTLGGPFDASQAHDAIVLTNSVPEANGRGQEADPSEALFNYSPTVDENDDDVVPYSPKRLPPSQQGASNYNVRHRPLRSTRELPPESRPSDQARASKHVSGANTVRRAQRMQRDGQARQQRHQELPPWRVGEGQPRSSSGMTHLAHQHQEQGVHAPVLHQQQRPAPPQGVAQPPPCHLRRGADNEGKNREASMYQTSGLPPRRRPAKGTDPYQQHQQPRAPPSSQFEAARRLESQQDGEILEVHGRSCYIPPSDAQLLGVCAPRATTQGAPDKNVVIMCQVPATGAALVNKTSPLRAPTRRSVIPRKPPRAPTTGFPRDQPRPGGHYDRHLRKFKETDDVRRRGRDPSEPQDNEDILMHRGSDDEEDDEGSSVEEVPYDDDGPTERATAVQRGHCSVPTAGNNRKEKATCDNPSASMVVEEGPTGPFEDPSQSVASSDATTAAGQSTLSTQATQEEQNRTSRGGARPKRKHGETIVLTRQKNLSCSSSALAGGIPASNDPCLDRVAEEDVDETQQIHESASVLPPKRFRAAPCRVQAIQRLPVVEEAGEPIPSTVANVTVMTTESEPLAVPHPAASQQPLDDNGEPAATDIVAAGGRDQEPPVTQAAEAPATSLTLSDSGDAVDQYFRCPPRLTESFIGSSTCGWMWDIVCDPSIWTAACDVLPASKNATSSTVGLDPHPVIVACPSSLRLNVTECLRLLAAYLTRVVDLQDQRLQQALLVPSSPDLSFVGGPRATTTTTTTMSSDSTMGAETTLAATLPHQRATLDRKTQEQRVLMSFVKEVLRMWLQSCFKGAATGAFNVKAAAGPSQEVVDGRGDQQDAAKQKNEDVGHEDKHQHDVELQVLLRQRTVAMTLRRAWTAAQDLLNRSSLMSAAQRQATPRDNGGRDNATGISARDRRPLGGAVSEDGIGSSTAADDLGEVVVPAPIQKKTEEGPATALIAFAVGRSDPVMQGDTVGSDPNVVSLVPEKCHGSTPNLSEALIADDDERFDGPSDTPRPILKPRASAAAVAAVAKGRISTGHRDARGNMRIPKGVITGGVPPHATPSLSDMLTAMLVASERSAMQYTKQRRVVEGLMLLKKVDAWKTVLAWSTMEMCHKFAQARRRQRLNLAGLCLYPSAQLSLCPSCGYPLPASSSGASQNRMDASATRRSSYRRRRSIEQSEEHQPLRRPERITTTRVITVRATTGGGDTTMTTQDYRASATDDGVRRPQRLSLDFMLSSERYLASHHQAEDATAGTSVLYCPHCGIHVDTTEEEGVLYDDNAGVLGDTSSVALTGGGRSVRRLSSDGRTYHIPVHQSLAMAARWSFGSSAGRRSASILFPTGIQDGKGGGRGYADGRVTTMGGRSVGLVSPGVSARRQLPDTAQTGGAEGTTTTLLDADNHSAHSRFRGGQQAGGPNSVAARRISVMTLLSPGYGILGSGAETTTKPIPPTDKEMPVPSGTGTYLGPCREEVHLNEDAAGIQPNTVAPSERDLDAQLAEPIPTLLESSTGEEQVDFVVDDWAEKRRRKTWGFANRLRGGRSDALRAGRR